MEEILRIILEYVSIWAPSLVAILGMVVTILTAINKTKEAFDNFKADTTLKDVNKKISELTDQNEELVRCNKLLLDNITKIQDYADNKKKEG